MERRWLRQLACQDNIEPIQPCCDPATFAAAQAELGESAAAWAIQTAARAAHASMRSSSDMEPPESLVRPVRRVTEACVLAVLRGLYRDLAPEQMGLPAEAVESARDAVHAGLALDRLLRTMWKAHVATIDVLLTDIRVTAPAGSWDEVGRRFTLLSFAYLDAFSEWIATEYNTERDAWTGSMAAARRAVVTAVLARRPVDVAEAERTLGLRLTDAHLAVVIWSQRREAVADHELRTFAAVLAGAVQAPRMLSVHGEPMVLWAWLALPDGPDPEIAARLRRTVTPPIGLRVATGPAVHGGTDGLRRSHLAACEARRLAALAGSWLCDYTSVAVPALMTMNVEHADWFAADALGALAGTDRRRTLLQDTLYAYLTSGRSRVAAAAALHVSTGTVAYRVRQAEELLGRPLDGMDRDVLAALEISRARRGP